MAEGSKESTSSTVSQHDVIVEDTEDSVKSPPNSPNSSTRKVFLTSFLIVLLISMNSFGWFVFELFWINSCFWNFWDPSFSIEFECSGADGQFRISQIVNNKFMIATYFEKNQSILMMLRYRSILNLEHKPSRWRRINP